MKMLKITVLNGYLNIIEEFFCRDVNISDPEEVECCAQECCGQYLDMHSDIINTIDADWDSIADACNYIIEEVSDEN